MASSISSGKNAHRITGVGQHDATRLEFAEVAIRFSPAGHPAASFHCRCFAHTRRFC